MKYETVKGKDLECLTANLNRLERNLEKSSPEQTTDRKPVIAWVLLVALAVALITASCIDSWDFENVADHEKAVSEN